MFGRKIVTWYVRDGESVIPIHESDGSAHVNINLVCDEIEFPNAVAMETYKQEKINQRNTRNLFAKLDAEEPVSTNKRISKEKSANLDVGDVDVSGWWG